VSSSLNKVQLIGNLGRDPEVRRMNNGNDVVSFSIACGETWKDKHTGDRKERTEWVNIVIFNEPLGQIAAKYLKKGSKAYIEGKLRTREYIDKDGNNRKSTEVVLENFQGGLLLLSPMERRDDRDDDRGGFGRSPGRGSDQDQERGRYHDDDERPSYGGSGRPATVDGGRPLNDALDDDIPF
jgi:single-strand DNA-binding protein